MWLRDCGRDLGEAALVEFFILWQVLAMVQLTPSREDTLRWCWSGYGGSTLRSRPTTSFLQGGLGTPRLPRSGALGHRTVASSLLGSFLEIGVEQLIALSIVTPATCCLPALQPGAGDDSTPASWLCGRPTSLSVGS
jgi:hypothetical protein